MKITKPLTLLLLVITMGSAFGQNNNCPQIPNIEVTGIAERELVPDEIYVSITLRERKQGKQKIDIKQQEENLKSALKGIGVDLNDLSLAHLSADYKRIRWIEKDVVAQSSYTLLVHDADMLGKVFEKLGELQILDASVTNVSHSKIEEHKKLVQLEAVKAARRKAGDMLGVINQKVGEPLAIREVDRPNHVYRLPGELPLRGYSNYANDIPDDSPALSFRKITLRASVYVKFRIN